MHTPRPTARLRRLARLAAASLMAWSAAAPALANPPDELPAAVRAALERAQLPPDALVAYVAELGAQSLQAPRLSHRPQQPVNPASLMKLYTTGAALQLLGPAWTWSTPVLASGAQGDGVLHGDLVIQGRGDPSLTIERLWLLLRQVQQRGIREVRGDIVLDAGAFTLPAGDAGDFDGERLRPYNVRPDALLFNLKSLTLAFRPDPARGVAQVSSDAALAGVRIDASVPLAPRADCGDWRGALRADFSDPERLRFAGSYPAGCGEKTWPLAYTEPGSYNARLLAALWAEVGGRLGGQVRAGSAPVDARLLFEFASPPLAAVVRDINKYSNNVMAQQLLLSLAGQAGGAWGSAGPVTPEAARLLLESRVRADTGCPADELAIDNGSGLSRSARSSARCLAAWLQLLWASPVMAELMSSLPVAGVDGTAQRAGRFAGPSQGRAHLKTGSLRDAAGVAGYVLANSGRRYALVAILNHPDAQAGRAALDALVRWAVEDAPR